MTKTHNSCCFSRSLLSVAGGVAITSALIVTMSMVAAIGGRDTSLYSLFADWLLGWPSSLLPLYGRVISTDDSLIMLFACNLLLYSALTNIVWQMKVARLRLP